MIVQTDPLPLTRTCFGWISDICYAWPVFATPQFEQFMKRVIVIGAGGHGREVADILRHQAQNESDLEIHGFVDEDPALDHKVINGLPVLGNWSWFEAVDRSEMAVLCAVGSPEIRKQLVERRLVEIAHVEGDVELRAELSAGSLRDREELLKLAQAAALEAFGNIRHD